MVASKIKIIGLILAVGLGCGTAHATDHPTCAGKYNNLCDTFGEMMINMKGKGCYRLMKIQPQGNDTYRLTCELASYDRSHITYTFQFTNNRQSYVVY